MFGTSKHGFSLLELLVVMFILGIMATIAVPMLRKKNPVYERTQFIKNLNILTKRAWQHALATHTVHRVFFDFQKNTVSIQQETDTQNHTFSPLQSAVASSFRWPEQYVVRQFFIEGVNALERSGQNLEASWFFIAPDGITQEVIINLVILMEENNGVKEVPLGLVVNPFSAQFKEYETFQQP